MVDLQNQYLRLKGEIDRQVEQVMLESAFIKGRFVDSFQQALSDYHRGCHVIPCANGTDALQLALMALDLQPGDEVIVPAFTYAATAEVIALLGLTPVLCDVDEKTFNATVEQINGCVSGKTKAIIVVHLFGQCSEMEEIMDFAHTNRIFVIEDNAQSIGSTYSFSSGVKKLAGTMGHIGTTSFFPSKNLGAYGDGGAVFTNDEVLAKRIDTIANHGQSKKYYHDVIGCNSRLDGMQAAILSVKLSHLDSFIASRQTLARKYDQSFASVYELETPYVSNSSSHVYHQYTVKVKSGKRDALKAHLARHAIPSALYYPLPLFEQKAFKDLAVLRGEYEVTKQLCKEVLSLPMHTEMSDSQSDYVVDGVNSFFNG